MTSVGQAALAVAVTLLPVHLLAPVAVNVSKYSQQLSGTTSLSVNEMLAPGARVVGPNTRWLCPMAAITLVTVTLISVIFPEFDTTPEMTSVPPGGTGLTGQLFLTVIEGEFVPGQFSVS